jgi:glycosyltransferase involved in cell wall biosynthesis
MQATAAEQPADGAFRPTVSVVMVTYNHERYIAQALDSALEQVTDFDFEIIVGEDCSTDRTREIVRDYAARAGGRVRLFARERNLGLSENLRRSWAACRGEYIAILEGDDYWTDSRKLQRQADALEAHPEWALCFHRARVINEDGRPPLLEPAEDDFPTESTLHDLLLRNFIVNVSVMYRGGLVKEVPQSFQRVVHQDWPLHILHARHGKAGYLPDVMGVWRHHPGGLWSAESECRRWTWIIDCFDLLEDELGQDHRDVIREARRSVVRRLCVERDTALASRDFRYGQALLRPARALRRWLRTARSSN